MENVNIIHKERVLVLANVIVAYATFVGVLSAIIYYIADIKGISILVGQTIGMIYILVAPIIFYWVSETLTNKGE
ncbi:hypothetical protein HY498_05225 [Candidatus Woesearchaeota archaeon]|nr:hypothetical protein [Candidatus Woesearchaeota archaeon]